MAEPISRFVARKGSWEYIIHVYDAATLSGPAPADGSGLRLLTSDGWRVVRIDKGVYDIVNMLWRTRVTSDDPNAP